MLRGKYTLLDRARVDLVTAKTMLDNTNGDDLVYDISAYHCSQCVEKIVKYLITLQSDISSPGHKTYEYLEDLQDEKIKGYVESIADKIDHWENQIRYSKTMMSNRKAIKEVIEVCEILLKHAEEKTPRQVEPDN